MKLHLPPIRLLGALIPWMLSFGLMSPVAFSQTFSGEIPRPPPRSPAYQLKPHDVVIDSNWSIVNPPEPLYYYQAIDMLDSVNGWLMGQDGGLFRTTNGGADWSLITDIEYVQLDFDFIDGARGWAVGDTVQRTVDSGATWSRVALTPVDYYRCVVFLDSLHGWIGGDDGFITHTTDGGASWVDQPTNTGRPISSICFITGSLGWAAAADTVILRTTNGGDTWTPYGVGYFTTAVFFTDSLNGWSAGAGLHQTTDGGLTWEPNYFDGVVFNDIIFLNDSIGFIVGYDPQPEPPSTIPCLWRTTDRGVSWTRLLYDYYWSGLAVYPPNSVWAAGEYNTIHSTDSGETWFPQHEGTDEDLYDIAFPDSLHGWAVGHNMTVIHTSDGGMHWGNQAHLGADLYGCSFVNSRLGWACGEVGTIIHTTDGGATWLDQVSSAVWSLYDIVFVDSMHGWAAGGSRTIIHTTDGGQTWNPQAGNGGSEWRSLDFLDTLHGVVCGGVGEVRRTSDGGMTWWNIDFPVQQFARSVEMIDDSTIWVVGNAGTIMLTDDAGISWADRSIPDWRNLTCVSFLDHDEGWIAGDEGRLYKTTNAGGQWLTVDVGYTGWYTGISFLDHSTGYLAGRAGVIIKTTTGGLTGVVESSGLPDEYRLHQNYPNPFNPSTIIRYDLPERTRVSLKLFNILGEEIQTLVDEDQSPGYKSIQFEGANLPTGVYLYRLQTGFTSAVRKMVLIR